MIAVERLDPARHCREAFASGNELLDEWLRRYAYQNDTRINSARTWVLVDDDIVAQSGKFRVLGYYALSMHALKVDELSDALRGRGWPQLAPAGPIGRLAIDRDYQGKGLGAALLRSAVEKLALADTQVALMLIVVDAIDEKAAEFYRRMGFRELPGDGRRLAIRMSDASSLLDEP